MDTINPKQAIDQFFQKALTGTQLLRQFATYANWIVPCSAAIPPLFLKFNYGSDEQGIPERHFFMFSDQAAYQMGWQSLGTNAMGNHYLTKLSGWSVWGNLDNDITVVNINPHSPNEIHYKAQQLPRLRQWAKILEVEQVLDQILQTGQGLPIVRNFEDYFIVIHPDKSIGLAPDAKGRRLVAIFTADDTLDAYLAQCGPAQEYILPGQQLFPALTQMALDGLVFNPCGPIPPRAFLPEFAQVVMEEA